MKFEKGIETKLTKNFVSTQFDCHCKRASCNTTLVEMKLLESLDELLEHLPKFFFVSAYRCYLHNKDVGGAHNSYHLKGLAVDVKSKYATPHEIKDAAERVAGFRGGGIGLYFGFTHLDARGYLARWGK